MCTCSVFTAEVTEVVRTGLDKQQRKVGEVSRQLSGLGKGSAELKTFSRPHCVVSNPKVQTKESKETVWKRGEKKHFHLNTT